ncbi:mechanosensitive ion channel family protein [Vibrio ostreicida]|uniref:Mechanosensitive ion channel family protein n=1 Tax=Vibrio ostreicida TaxID=526588 RepID=A0ABT8BZ70_9VIBR|nr:mechanosensitive ion channel family protein [Vibrio ostreicida]MDN3612461.1 mechanosensitive ion channel family protein [Vibrio ostreicida]NPD10170.1 mechanosensitive ion channel family protein [Vibrio ostreicida]
MNELVSLFPQRLATLLTSWDSNVWLITAASLLAWIAWRVVYNRLEILVCKTPFYWDNLTLHALKTPVSTLIWCWPATISLGFILQDYMATKLNWLNTLKILLVIGAFIWITLRLINNIEKYVLEQKKRDETTVQAIAKVSRLFFIVIAVLTIMQAFGLSLSGLLTFGGVGGLVVGLAAKDLLSNFFGGMMIYFDRPFKVGDWVRSPDRQIEGTVERIGWRMTIIRTFDKRPLYVPNSVFSNIVVENPSRMLNRRIKETIGVRYDDGQKVKQIVQDIKQMLREHADIDTKQTLIVNFNAFGPSSMQILVYTFTKTVNWIRYHEVKEDVLLKIMGIIHQHGADIAFPTQTLKFEQPMDFSTPSHPREPQNSESVHTEIL